MTTRPVARVDGGTVTRGEDAIAVERALEVHLGGRAIAVTLRTPGRDRELALGFLAGEGLVRGRSDVTDVREEAADCDDRPDSVHVTLAPGVPIDWARLERHFAATSACGLCGRAHVESLRAGLSPIEAEGRFAAERIALLPGVLRAAQEAFTATGALHAAAFCEASLEVSVVREDVGRHNAVDKVSGWLLQHDRFPADNGLLWVSGRAGAEIVLKAARARIPVVAAVGAPSSLAVELAETARLTLIGFLRDGRMNVYTGLERIVT